MQQAGPVVPMSPMRGLRFDGILVVGCALLALLCGAIARANPYDPEIFTALLLTDIYLLGSHHIVAMYTRLCFDKESLKQNRFFLTGLPVLVILAIIAAMAWKGAALITTIYLYWQWFHYTRQSYGITRIYARKEPAQSSFDIKLTNFMLYTVPLWGILFISRQHNLNPDMKFLGSEFYSLPISAGVLDAVGLVALGATVLWVVRLPMRYLEKKLAVLPTLYIISHLVIFTVGYYWLGKISLNLGWLVINIWHNCQYILIVWLYNNNRFRNGVDQNHPFLSTLSQEKFLWRYFGVCILVTAVLSLTMKAFAGYFAPNYLPNMVVEGGWAVLIYQGLNFHHYIVDSYIWKVRKKEVRERLGVVDEEIANVAH